MDTLLATLVMTLVAEMGDRTQLLLAVLALRYARHFTVFAGFFVATIVNCALSAYAGTLIAELIAGPALVMFQAIAVLFAAAAMLWPRRKLDRLEGWRMPPFWTAFLGCLILEFGDKSQFLVLAASANSGLPILVAIGGILGISAAAIPALAMPQSLTSGTTRFKALRIGGGVALLILAAVLAYQSLTA